MLEFVTEFFQVPLIVDFYRRTNCRGFVKKNPRADYCFKYQKSCRIYSKDDYKFKDQVAKGLEFVTEFFQATKIVDFYPRTNSRRFVKEHFSLGLLLIERSKTMHSSKNFSQGQNRGFSNEF